MNLHSLNSHRNHAEPNRTGPVAVIASCVTLFAAASAAPSGTVAKPSTPSTLKPVDPGVGDVGPLSGPGRVLPKDLRQPANFDRVYEVEKDGKRYFVRAHGGVYAVFPRSDYIQTAQGVSPIVPAGTVFHLGSLPRAQATDAPKEPPTLPAAPKPARPMRLDQAAPDTAAPNAVSAQTQPAPSARPQAAQRASNEPPLSDAPPAPRMADRAVDSIWVSEFYRVARTSELLEQAKEARLRATPPIATSRAHSDATPAAK